MTQVLARPAAPLNDRQLRTRLEIASGKGFTLEGATSEQLNMVYLVAQRYELDPLTHVGLFQGKPWYTLDGRIHMARRHPQYRGYHTRPLTKDEKEAWGYKPDDLVVECTMRTRDWGDIVARGKVTAVERGKNTPTGSHPQEMAEKRAIARASRMAFGLEVPDETDAEVADEERNQPEKLAQDGARYAEIFGADEDHSPYELPARVVDTETGEVLEAQPPPPPPSTGGFVAHTNDRGETIHMPSTRHDVDATASRGERAASTPREVDDVKRGQEIVERAHAAARQRDLDLAEVDRQRHEEGLL